MPLHYAAGRDARLCRRSFSWICMPSQQVACRGTSTTQLVFPPIYLQLQRATFSVQRRLLPACSVTSTLYVRAPSATARRSAESVLGMPFDALAGPGGRTGREILPQCPGKQLMSRHWPRSRRSARIRSRSQDPAGVLLELICRSLFACM